METGDYFGEIALLNNCQRTSTVTTITYCTFAVIDKAKFFQVGTSFIESLFEMTNKYDDKVIKQKV
jgi:CRP-like cAMP-binding protein